MPYQWSRYSSLSSWSSRPLEWLRQKLELHTFTTYRMSYNTNGSPLSRSSIGSLYKMVQWTVCHRILAVYVRDLQVVLQHHAVPAYPAVLGYPWLPVRLYLPVLLSPPLLLRDPWIRQHHLSLLSPEVHEVLWVPFLLALPEVHHHKDCMHTTTNVTRTGFPTGPLYPGWPDGPFAPSTPGPPFSPCIPGWPGWPCVAIMSQ